MPVPTKGRDEKVRPAMVSAEWESSVVIAVLAWACGVNDSGGNGSIPIGAGRRSRAEAARAGKCAGCGARVRINERKAELPGGQSVVSICSSAGVTMQSRVE